MGIQKHISVLLYRYNCVIVPNFGGFVTNAISATIQKDTHTFYPPSKQITFNPHLQNNDGLLANYIAKTMEVSYEAAINYITSEVNSWNKTLQKEMLELDGVGTFSKNLDNNLIFEPTSAVNYLTSSFGLDTFHSPAIKRLAYKETIANLGKAVPVIPIEEKNKRKVPVFLKYAATIAIIATLGTFGWHTYQNNYYNQNQIVAEQQQRVNEKIQKATFEIPDTLPLISLNLTKEIKSFHIVAGAFREPTNAEKKVQQLISKGYNAKILGKNKWNLTVVAFDSYVNKKDAINNLRKIKKTASSDAWLLVKTF